MNRSTFIFGLIILVFLASLSLATIPKLINYQGMLTDNSGTPLTDTLNITFKIYDDPSAGNKKWEETQNNVPVINGLFNVILGSVTPIDTLSFNQDYWLDITVGAEHMPTRLKFTSVGYAYRAWKTQRADTADIALSAPGGSSGNTWNFRVTDTADTTLITGSNRWGIARYGNTLYGNADSTHVNLGVACTTGTSGQNYKYCTVGGGWLNTASGDKATVGGGRSNTASGSYATVGGGWYHTASGGSGTVGGGYFNTASGTYAAAGGGRVNTASGYCASVAGGGYNAATGDSATVGGGTHNTASDYSATVGGGSLNTASDYSATVGGGSLNTASWYYATVGGGYSNTANGGHATVGGGYSNTAGGSYATVGGGYSNHASFWYTTVGGGSYDTAIAFWATVPGGRNNTASGVLSFAAGYKAKALHSGAFVWADSTDADFASTKTNQFSIRAGNGVRLDSDAGSYKTIDIGERYRDNAIVAWGKVSSGGTLSAEFGVTSVTNDSAGVYTVTLDATASDAATLIPIAQAEVEAPGTIRIVSINQTSTKVFEVYINNNSFNRVNNDFVFMVTAR